MIRSLLVTLNKAVAKAPAAFALAWLCLAALGIAMGAQLPNRLASADAPPGASESGQAARMLKEAFPAFAGANHLIVLPTGGAGGPGFEITVDRAERAAAGTAGIRAVRRWPGDGGPEGSAASAAVLVAVSDSGPAGVAAVQALRKSLGEAGFSADQALPSGSRRDARGPRGGPPRDAVGPGPRGGPPRDAVGPGPRGGPPRVAVGPGQAQALGPRASRLPHGATPDANPPLALVTGAPAAAVDVFDLLGKRLGQVERVSLLVSAVILVYVFGSWLLAGLALLSGLVCLAILPALLVGLSHLWPVTAVNMAVAAVISLALGLDYPLLLLTRFRQEFRGDIGQALERTLETAGSTLVTSGVVMVAGGLSVLLVPLGEVRSVALTMAFSSVLALGLSLTFIPAILRLLAVRWDLERFLGKRRQEKADRYWRGLASLVAARPRTALAASLLVLAALAAPAFWLRTWSPYVSMLPAGLESRRGLDILLEAGHGGLVSPLIVLWKTGEKGGALTPGFVGHLQGVTASLEADPRISRVESVAGLAADPRAAALLLRSPLSPRSAAGISADGTVALMRVVPRAAPDDPAGAALVGDIRAALARTPYAGATAVLGGMQAEQADIQVAFGRGIPAVLGFNLVVIPLILAAAFRSAILPLKAVLTNLLPVLAGLGVVTARFQWFDGTGALYGGHIQAMTVAIMFSLLFAISMDYEIFLLARIREAYDDSGENRDAVVTGLGSSGRVVVGAALVLLSVFVPYLFVEIRTLQELGTGLSVATLLDATIVRLVLVPSAMLVLGNWNYWLPGLNSPTAAR